MNQTSRVRDTPWRTPHWFCSPHNFEPTIQVPPHEVALWPWPLRVRTLGSFEVLVHDEPLAFGRKAPKKTLALLKALIARGGSAPDGVLIDQFWPDEQGDAAAKSLGAAVHRLRTLLGVPGAVGQHGGQLSLERELVWVEAWSFQRAPAAAPDRLAPVSRFGNENGQTTYKSGNGTFQFGQQRSFEQKYNTDNIFNPYTREGR